MPWLLTTILDSTDLESLDFRPQFYSEKRLVPSPSAGQQADSPELVPPFLLNRISHRLRDSGHREISAASRASPAQGTCVDGWIITPCESGQWNPMPG